MLHVDLSQGQRQSQRQSQRQAQDRQQSQRTYFLLALRLGQSDLRPTAAQEKYSQRDASEHAP